ncbi:MAG: GntR family transcriptional regulator [Candidatus Limiplasma sp.]|nr:GntR family transcriptional regulator [Candidatus Limiplasma sp.]
MKSDILLQQDFSMESNLALSYQLSQIVRQLVDSGELAAGDLIPTEEAFCNAYNISRSTVRQALKVLVVDGLLVRVRGKGTFVSGKKLRRKMESVYSFTHEMEAMGKKASSRILVFRKMMPANDVAQFLFDSNEDASEVYHIIRIRMADGVPLLMESVYIPVSVIPGLTEERLQGNSLYDILRDDAGVIPVHAEESYESILLDKGTCDLLGCPKNTTGFFIRRLAYDKDDRVYELTQSVMRGDQSKIVVSLTQGNYSVKRNLDKRAEDRQES